MNTVGSSILPGGSATGSLISENVGQRVFFICGIHGHLGTKLGASSRLLLPYPEGACKRITEREPPKFKHRYAVGKMSQLYSASE